MPRKKVIKTTSDMVCSAKGNSDSPIIQATANRTVFVNINFLCLEATFRLKSVEIIPNNSVYFLLRNLQLALEPYVLAFVPDSWNEPKYRIDCSLKPTKTHCAHYENRSATVLRYSTTIESRISLRGTGPVLTVA